MKTHLNNFMSVVLASISATSRQSLVFLLCFSRVF